MPTPEEAKTSANEKLVNKEQVTAGDLNALSASLHAMPAQQLSALKANLDTYRAEQQARLAADPDTDNAFHALQVSVQEEEIKKRAATPAASTETPSADPPEAEANAMVKMLEANKIGAKIEEKFEQAKVIGGVALDKGVAALETTSDRLGGVIDRQIDFMTDSKNTTGQKVMRGATYVLGLIGIIKAAQFIKGSDQSSFLGKAFRGLGLTALSVWLINKFVKKSDAEIAAEQAAAAGTPTQAPTNAAPTQTQTTRTAPLPDQGPAKGTPPQNQILPAAPNVTAAPLLSQIPEGNLLNTPPHTVTIDGMNHAVSFTKDHIVIGDKKYGMTALNVVKDLGLLGKTTLPRVPLQISIAKRQGTTLKLEAGLGDAKESADMSENEVASTLRTLIAQGTYTFKTEKGQEIAIERK